MMVEIDRQASCLFRIIDHGYNRGVEMQVCIFLVVVRGQYLP